MRTGTCQRPSSEIRCGPWSTKAWRILGLTVRTKFAKSTKFAPFCRRRHRHLKGTVAAARRVLAIAMRVSGKRVSGASQPFLSPCRYKSELSAQTQKVQKSGGHAARPRRALARLARERRTGRRCRALGTERLAAAGMPPSMRRTHDADGRAIRWWRVLGRPPRVCGQTARYDMSAFGAGAARATVDERGWSGGGGGPPRIADATAWSARGFDGEVFFFRCRPLYVSILQWREGCGCGLHGSIGRGRTRAAGRRRGSRQRLRRDRAGDAKRIAALGSLTGRLSHS